MKMSCNIFRDIANLEISLSRVFHHRWKSSYLCQVLQKDSALFSMVSVVQSKSISDEQ